MSLSIPLTHNKTMLIDKDDYEKFKHLSMYAVNHHGNWYVQVSYAKTRKQALHRLILDAPKGIQVDHINNNGLDNRRCNLRLATNSQNHMNTTKRVSTRNSSKYKGVSWVKRDNRWFAQIFYEGKAHHIGSFTNEEDAARAYDTEARKRFGEFARLNFGGM